MVYPPLFVFKDSPPLEVLVSGNEGLEFVELDFDQNSQRMTFKAQIVKDMENTTELSILLNPTLSMDSRYESTPPQTYTFDVRFPSHLPYFYSEIALMCSKMLLYLNWASVVLAWLAILLGFVFKRLAGLEAMLVLQFAFVNMLWVDSYLHPYYEQTWPLKFSTGFAMSFAEEEKFGFLYTAPFTSQFGVSVNLINNFNIMVIFQLIPLLMAAISKVVILKMQKNYDIENEKFKEIENNESANLPKPKKLKIAELIFENALQIFFFFTVFNLIPLICFSVLFFTQTDISNISNVPLSNFIVLSV